MKKARPQHSISGFAALAVAALFALCVLSALLAGIGAYRCLAQEGQESYACRTCAGYISAKVRQSETGAALTVESFDGTPALVLEETVEGAAYITQIYCWDGWLMELFSAQDAELAPEDGERLLPARSLIPREQDGLLEVVVTDGYGNESSLVFSLRGGEEAADAK